MKSEELYEGLKNLAERLGVTVLEKSFKRMGVRVKGGHCVVKGKQMFLIDKQINASEKIEMLAEHLATLPTESLYVVPAIRQRLKIAGKGGKGVLTASLDKDS